MLLPRILVLAVSSVVLALAPPTVDALVCSKFADTATYNAVLAQMTTCEKLTSITLSLPLADKKTQQPQLCAKCTELKTTIVTSGAVPDCKYEPAGKKLDKFLQKLFGTCVGGSSSSGSDDDDDDDSGSTGSTGSTAVVTTTKAPSTMTTKAPSTTTTKTPASSTNNGTAAGANGNLQVADIEGTLLYAKCRDSFPCLVH